MLDSSTVVDLDKLGKTMGQPWPPQNQPQPIKDEQVGLHVAEASARLDPAPDPVELAKTRAQQLVDNITSQALDELRKMRDQIDALMTDISDSHDSVTDSIVEHTRKVSSAISAKVIIVKALTALQKEFSPRPGTVITQQNNR